MRIAACASPRRALWVRRRPWFTVRAGACAIAPRQETFRDQHASRQAFTALCTAHLDCRRGVPIGCLTKSSPRLCAYYCSLHHATHMHIQRVLAKVESRGGHLRANIRATSMGSYATPRRKFRRWMCRLLWILIPGIEQANSMIVRRNCQTCTYPCPRSIQSCP